MAEFKIKSDFSPSGDQPQAISSLVNGINSNTKSQVLLGLPVQVRPLRWQT